MHIIYVKNSHILADCQAAHKLSTECEATKQKGEKYNVLENKPEAKSSYMHNRKGNKT